jgi:hypothetical protein
MKRVKDLYHPVVRLIPETDKASEEVDQGLLKQQQRWPLTKPLYTISLLSSAMLTR